MRKSVEVVVEEVGAHAAVRGAGGRNGAGGHGDAGNAKTLPVSVGGDDEDRSAAPRDALVCCFSESGGCLFSMRDECCCSDTDGCCFSSDTACCFSGTNGRLQL